MKAALLRLLGGLLLLGVAAAAVTWDAHRQLRAVLPIQEHLNVDVAPGSSLREAIGQLRARGLFGNPRQPVYLELWGRVSGDAARLKVGEYSLDPGLSSLDVLALWVGGKTVLHELRIVEGLSFAQAMQRVAEHPMLQHSLPDLRAETVMRALGRADQHPEGRLFPDTYRFPRNTTDLTVLQQALGAMDRALKAAWDGRAQNLPYASAEDALIMASIVEKETGVAEERARIAGVFVRRLRLGMRLQTDPTVIYGLGAAFDGNLRKRDLLADGPYNTYQRTGLPPTPICLPGRAAIEAALHPADGTELFFVARGDGSHQFSTTLEEHDAAVRKYQLRLPPAASAAEAPRATPGEASP